MLWLLLLAPSLAAAPPAIMFNERGVTSIDGLKLTRDEFALTIDGKAIAAGAPRVESGNLYRYTAGDYRIEVRYDVRPTYLRKSIRIIAPAGRKFRVNEVAPLVAELGEPIRDMYVRHSDYPRLQTGDYGAFLRFANSRGLLAAAENPFCRSRATASRCASPTSPTWSGTPRGAPLSATPPYLRLTSSPAACSPRTCAPNGSRRRRTPRPAWTKPKLPRSPTASAIPSSTTRRAL